MRNKILKLIFFILAILMLFEIFCMFSDRCGIFNNQTLKVRFFCKNNKWMDVIFYKNHLNVVNIDLSDGRSFVLTQGISGSGARYTDLKETKVLWIKGNTAFFEENGLRTYEGATKN